MPCLNDATLVAVAEGALEPTRRTDALAHLERCATCSMLVAQASRLCSDERRVLGRYLVHGELGTGGMGRVMRAFDPRLGRDVALKILLAANTAKGGRRLLREARALALLNHPNVVAIYDVHSADSELFVAMELIEGVNLRTWLSEPRGVAEIQRAFAAAGRGLLAAHAAGLTHRDFKPANVMLDAAGRVTVVDFGLATADPTWSSSGPSHEDSMVSHASSTHRAVGTPRYMAPEQYEGTADARADQYQFCLSLLEALAGRFPFANDGTTELAAAKNAERFRSGVFERVPSELRGVIKRGLRADPEQRWPTLEPVVSALESPRKGGRVAAAVVAAGGIVGGVAYAVAPSRTASCSDATARLAGVWDDARAERLHQAFEGTGFAHAGDIYHRVKRNLDDYRETWMDSYARACAMTKAEARLKDAKMRCLERTRNELRGMVDALELLDAAEVSASLRTTGGLTPLDRCDEKDWLTTHVPLPNDPSAQAAIERLQTELDRTRASILAGRFDEALASLDAVEAESASLDYEPLTVRLLSLRTNCLRALDRPSAVDVGEEAYLAARLLGDDLTAWKIAADVSTAYRRMGDYESAREWIVNNEQVVASLNDPMQTAAYQSVLGAYYDERGEVEAALSANTTAAKIAAEVDPGSREHGVYVRRVGSTFRHLNRFDDANERFEEARRILEAYGGEHDPEIRILEFAVGMTAVNQEDFDAAVPHLERAMRMTIDAMGSESTAAVESRGALAFAYRGAGRTADAERTLGEALALADAAGLSTRARVVMGADFAQLQADRGETDAAAKGYAAALRIADSMKPSPMRSRLVAMIEARKKTLE